MLCAVIEVRQQYVMNVCKCYQTVSCVEPQISHFLFLHVLNTKDAACKWRICSCLNTTCTEMMAVCNESDVVAVAAGVLCNVIKFAISNSH